MRPRKTGRGFHRLEGEERTRAGSLGFSPDRVRSGWVGAVEVGPLRLTFLPAEVLSCWMGHGCWGRWREEWGWNPPGRART
jgi:hypothetical protein